MTRAAEKPLPPPPPGSVWERIERARETLDLGYRTLSLLASGGAEGSGGHYRTIAIRNGWKSKTDVQDRFITALVAKGVSAEWLRAGTGEMFAEGAAPAAPVASPAVHRTVELDKDANAPTDARDRVIDALIADGVTDDHGLAYRTVRSIAFQGGGDELSLYRQARDAILRTERPHKKAVGSERTIRGRASKSGEHVQVTLPPTTPPPPSPPKKGSP